MIVLKSRNALLDAFRVHSGNSGWRWRRRKILPNTLVSQSIVRKKSYLGSVCSKIYMARWQGLRGRRTMTFQRCLKLQYLRHQELEGSSFLCQLLVNGTGWTSVSSKTVISLSFFFFFYKFQSMSLDSRRAGGKSMSSDKCHFLKEGFPSAVLDMDVWVLSHGFPRGLEVRQKCSLLSKETGPHFSQRWIIHGKPQALLKFLF